MNREGKQGLFILSVVVVAIIVYAGLRVLGENEESRIRKVINTAVLAVEKNDTLRCASLVSGAYEDKYGNSKLTLLRIVQEIFNEYKDFKVVIKQMNIEIKDNASSADVAFTSYFKQAGESQIYYDSGKIKVGLIKEDGRWRIHNLEYLGSQEMLFLQSVA